MNHNEFNAATASDQEVFDYAMNHLRTARAMATRTQLGCSPTCAYRGDNGTMCAFGVFIWDDEYSLSFEGCDAYGVARQIERLANLSDTRYALFNALQYLHDQYLPEYKASFSSYAARFEHQAASVALRFGLIYTPPA